MSVADFGGDDVDAIEGTHPSGSIAGPGTCPPKGGGLSRRAAGVARGSPATPAQGDGPRRRS
ncbi:hypothetical protein C8T65DRAFT_631392 [Cerioporus squamosus]|nr:hypothetical protein C8T65DRAFT_631392 [Cerioporus squamosus]